MAHSSKSSFFPDERVVEVSPRFTPRVSDPTPRRLNYVAGRSLSADALKLEQTNWDRKVTLLARAVNPGIQSGLEVELLSADPSDAAIRVTAGRGLTDRGEDVILHRNLTARIGDIPAAEPMIEDKERPIGLVGLFLKSVRVVSAANFDPTDPCPIDPDAYAYDDLIMNDGAQLVWASLNADDDAELPIGADRFRPVAHISHPEKIGVLGDLSSTNVLLPPNPLLGRKKAQLIPTSVYRNAVANKMIEREEESLRRGTRPPWSEHGLPLAIAEITKEGHVLFVDRFSIARFGGAVRSANPSNVFGLSETLRRARFDQFIEHLQGLRAESAALAPATQFFRRLPPVGVLPATIFDTEKMATEFFPANFVIEAAPIQLTQMESLLATRSGLEPFDLSRRDYVQLLVPVPDHLFDPKLLLKDEISSVFQDAINDAHDREFDKLQELKELEAVEAFVLGLVEMSSVTKEARDLPRESSFAGSFAISAVKAIKRMEPHYKDVPLTVAQAAQISEVNFELAAEAILDGKPNTSPFKGLKLFSEELAQQLDKANDTLDMGFLRLQSDIYRARKQMVGETDATRLATSPVLANLSTNITSLEASKLFGEAVNPPISKTNLKSNQITQMISQPFMAVKSSSKPTMAHSIPTYSKSFTGSFGKMITPIAPVKNPTPKLAPLDFKVFGLSSIKADLNSNILKASDVAWHSLIYGKGSPVRTLTVAERLRPSPAQEAKNAAVATKAEIIRGVQELGLNLESLSLPVSASRVTLIPKADLQAKIAQLRSASGVESARVAAILEDGDAVPIDGKVAVLSDRHLLDWIDTEFPVRIEGEVNVINTQSYKLMQKTTAELYTKRVGLDYDNLAGLILSDRLDPDPQDADEGAFFAAAVDALESAVSMLRLFEGRVQSYTSFLDRLRKSLLAAVNNTEKWQNAIDVVNADIAEAMHDQAVALALQTEEQARIDAINLRRADILEKHVDIIAFARPMSAERLNSAPGVSLYRPLSEILPACLETDEDLPDELEQMLDAMRDAPIAWYPELAKGLRAFRNPKHFITAWRHSLDRAGLWMAQNAKNVPNAMFAAQQRRVSGKATTGIYLALAAAYAHRRAILKQRLQRDLQSLYGASWKSLYQISKDELSIQDLENSGKAGRKVAGAGIRMLEQIGAVAGCFLAGLRGTKTDVRLLWAERLSEHDDAMDLSNLNALVGWASVPLEQRRELEYLHNWMFAKIDKSNEQARTMMSELTRVCLLMSSHAPISSILEGEVVETKNINEGETFEVDIKTGTPSIGMVATIGTGKNTSLGVIDDIVGSRVLVRATKVRQARLPIGLNHKIVFTPAVAIKLANFGQ
jgi:hypothetical protein